MSKTSSIQMAAGTGLSGHLDPITAAEQTCADARAGLGDGPADLAILMASGEHARAIGRIGRTVRERLGAQALLGVSAEGVIGGESELERQTGVSLLALRLPGVSLRLFTTDDLPPLALDDADLRADAAAAASALGVERDTRAIFMFGDPRSFPVIKLLPALSALPRVVPGLMSCSIFGGMASAHSIVGANSMLVGDRLLRRGGVGVVIGGDVAVDCIVSQGCRPVGPPMVVTKARRNVVQSLGNRPALHVIRDTLGRLGEADRELLRRGMFIGRVINEYKDRFGRGDFLVRPVLGIDDPQNAIALGDFVRVGQTIQLHVRDAAAASEDLQLLMDAQRVHTPPVAALLVSCFGRGVRLFETPNHDAAIVHRALQGPGGPGGAGGAGGSGGSGGAGVPLAGFFAAGEIGPVGDQSFLHGQSAAVAMFRAGAQTL